MINGHKWKSIWLAVYLSEQGFEHRKCQWQLQFKGGALDVRRGQAVATDPGEWVRYSSPEPGGAEYIAVCIPAFTPGTVHRDLE